MQIQNDRILRVSEVASRIGVSRATIYVWVKQGSFPQQVVLGANSVGWLESAVNAWLAARVPRAA